MAPQHKFSRPFWSFTVLAAVPEASGSALETLLEKGWGRERFCKPLRKEDDGTKIAKINSL